MLIGLDETDTDFDTIGKEGGSKTHTLTKAELPNEGILVELSSQQFQSGTGSWGATYNATSPNINTKPLGSGQAFSIQNKYEVVGYMWIRRA